MPNGFRGPDKKQRTRRCATEAEKSARAAKKRKGKEAEKKRKEKEANEKEAKQRKLHFFRKKATQQEEVKENPQEEAKENQNENHNQSNERAAGASVAEPAEAADENDSFHTAVEEAARIETADGWENLESDDEDSNLEWDDDPVEDPFDNFERDHSTMGKYLESVYKRLQKETKQSTATVDPWLMQHL